MIISRTPLRLSFFGGGTDLKEFYGQEGGLVLSTAINKYVFITVNKKFDDHIRVSYSQTEIVELVDQVQHGLVREAMKLTGVDRGIEITTIADIPSQGTGLGSSSTFTVGLLQALSSYRGFHVGAEKLASDACKIEIEILEEPIGKQDQYIAAYGGFQLIQFNQDGSVFVDPVICPARIKDKLQGNLLLFYTGITRKAKVILAEQKKRSEKERITELRRIKELVSAAKAVLQTGQELDDFGRLLDESWQLKKRLASGVTNDVIDDLYVKARLAGALGGKIAGAGGGGFLLLYVPSDKQVAVRQALNSLPEIPFSFEPQGSKIIYVG